MKTYRDSIAQVEARLAGKLTRQQRRDYRWLLDRLREQQRPIMRRRKRLRRMAEASRKANR